MVNASKKISQEQELTGAKTEKDINSFTPMMQQYIGIKNNYPDYLVFYRMGDFYELFLEDATIAAKELDIILTKRGKNNEEDIPMCGVPHHSYESYLNRLIKKGYKVVICEQTETPEEAKKSRGYKALVKREVTRIVTQGTLTDEKMLDQDSSNNLVSINSDDGENFAIAWCDISTGDLFVNEVDKISLSSEIDRINPAEIVICDDLIGNRDIKGFIDNHRNILTSQNKSFFSTSRTKDKVLNYFELKNLNALSNINEAEINTLGALIEYIEVTQVNDRPNLSLPKTKRELEFMEIDFSTFRNLEIFRSFEGKKEGSLFGILNHTRTSCGARLLQEFLARPLKNAKEINERFDGIEFLINNSDIAESLNNTLSRFPDIERISSRIYSGKGTPRDIGLLRDGLFACIKLSEIFSFCNKSDLPTIFKNASKNLNDFESLYHKINKCMIEFPPININEGGFIRSGFEAKLDDYRNTKYRSQELKNELLEKYKKETGIQNLKIKENNVIGMFLETNPNNTEKVPPSFIHKQTLASAVRYTTEELRDIEAKIINAESYGIAIEVEIFEGLRKDIIAAIEGLRTLSKSVALIDVIYCFADISSSRNYARPEMKNSDDFDISKGRHPVVEVALKETRNSDNPDYTPNDTNLSNDKIWLLTGPNMSGKSTFLRQNALICIMAHIGCYVPAEKAVIGTTDKVFSRVGASDNLSKGQSTFMVEMTETAFILNNATERSFVILDEIGRGTSTFDGLSIAWATLEYIDKNIKCRTLFATHYHELTSLAKNSKNIENYTLQTQEWEGDIIFKHNVVKGAAGQSYGIFVAKLAGLPKQLTGRATEILNILQEKNKGNSTEILSNELPLFEKKTDDTNSTFKLNQETENLKKILEKTDIENLTPIQALNLLSELKSKI